MTFGQSDVLLCVEEIGADYSEGHHHDGEVDNIASIAGSVCRDKAEEGHRVGFAAAVSGPGSTEPLSENPHRNRNRKPNSEKRERLGDSEPDQDEGNGKRAVAKGTNRALRSWVKDPLRQGTMGPIPMRNTTARSRGPLTWL